MTRERTGFEIAVVGLAGRFPGAADIDAFWDGLCRGEEGIRHFSAEELASFGIDAATIADPAFVPAHGAVSDIDHFDYAFFGYSRREAELMDPQHRIFLQVAWHALEDAGIDPQRHADPIAVIAGASANDYLRDNVMRNPQALQALGFFQARMANLHDFLATNISFKLGLRGPGFTVASSCSTSLLAVHVACQQLIHQACDVAIAGGASLRVPQHRGYRYQQGHILAPDGHCRAFDEAAAGTVAGDGVGAVVLKRLEDAEAAGDRILAVVLASAANNDGDQKVGFTAPAQAGQAQVIDECLQLAEIDPASIGYVECHGTGTPLGDPIEVGALSEAWARHGLTAGDCRVGSVKANIGHLDSAAGIAGFIKATLCVERGQLPPLLHIEQPNSRIAWEQTPFQVTRGLEDFPVRGGADGRRAAVSSYGIGGTNVHVLLEQAPAAAPVAAATGGERLLLLSARDDEALGRAATRLADHLEAHPALALDDVAATLLRRHRSQRFLGLVAGDLADAVTALRDRSRQQLYSAKACALPLAMLFPGQGSQRPGMGLDLAAAEPVFAAALDEVGAALAGELEMPLRDLLASDAETLRQTRNAQPAIFAVGYATWRLLSHWGIEPGVVIGHSIGEFTAAVAAGIFTVAEAARLVAARGRLMQAMEPGGMLSVPLAAAELRMRLPATLDLAADNGPELSVAAGPEAALDAFAAQLADEGIIAKRLQTSHAFHSRMMAGALEGFAAILADMRPQAPRCRLLSTVTGRALDAATAADPQHWLANLREPVRFREAVDALFADDGARLLLEVGPGQALTSLLRSWPQAREQQVVPCAPHPRSDEPAHRHLLAALAACTAAGHEPTWETLVDTARPPVRLPGYPFAAESLWIEPQADLQTSVAPASVVQPDLADWFSRPVWRELAQAATPLATPRSFLIAGDRGWTSQLVERSLADQVCSCVDLQELASRFADDAAAGKRPDAVVVVITPGAGEAAVHALHAFAQALQEQGGDALDCCILTFGAQAVWDGDCHHADGALALGPAIVLPQEFPALRVACIDLPAAGSAAERLTAGDWLALRGDCLVNADEAQLAYRGGRRWQRRWQAEPVAELLATDLPQRWLITGGLGGIGGSIARELADLVPGVCLALTARAPLPPEETWPTVLAGDDRRLAARISLVQELRAAGATVCTLACDVADRAAVAAGITSAEAQFGGAIDGLVHAAGIPADGKAFADKDRAAIEAVLAAKRAGTDLLLELLPPERLTRCVLMSSMAAFVGAIGQADYAAANAYQAAVAQRERQRGHHCLAIEWYAWREVGMAVAGELADFKAQGDAAFADFIPPDQGRAAFRRLLAEPAAEVAVCPLPIAAVEATFGGMLQEARQRAAAAAAVAGSDAAALAENDEQAAIMGIWQELLGASGISPEDDFFALGGHSLMAAQVAARIDERCGCSLQVRDILETPRLRDLAALLTTADDREEIEI